MKPPQRLHKHYTDPGAVASEKNRGAERCGRILTDAEGAELSEAAFAMRLAGALGYELSQAVGEPLFELCKRTNIEAIVTESSVCSIQLGEGTGLEVWHPLMLLDAMAAGV